ncbi:SAF domain-containing protein [Nocardioides houyundeii]|uniref:SAF domain-containing protein n=1 Tax=Nocardioides houyundeii TaxID=2045452 RepID=UPI000DF1159D|nr:SAF domain-containing protein [Nocardioides houyundeii]
MVFLGSPAARVRGLRRRVLAHRRLLAFGCAAAAAAAAVTATAPPPAPSERVLVATRDLPSGTVLAPGDLTRAAWPAGAAPDGAVRLAVGRTLAAPVRRGEPMTDLRLTTPGLLQGYPGLVAVPVRVPDPAVVALLRVGDRVDLLAADPETATAEVVARSAEVLALPSEVESPAQGVTGRLVVLGLAADEVAPVSVAAVRDFITLTFSG